MSHTQHADVLDVDECDDEVGDLAGVEWAEEYAEVDFNVPREEVINRIEVLVCDAINEVANGRLPELLVQSRDERNCVMVQDAASSNSHLRLMQSTQRRTLLANQGASSLAFVRGEMSCHI
jgi:hypothetical protein